MTGQTRVALRRFARRSDGGITVEFVLWLPIFMAILMLCADSSLLFMRQSNLWSVSRDTARIVSRHGLDSVAAENYARGEARIGDYTPNVSVKIDGLASTVTVSITSRAEELAPFGMIGFALDNTISTLVVQTLEPI